MKPLDRTVIAGGRTRVPVPKLDTPEDVLDEMVRLLARIAAERDFAHFLETGRSPYDGLEVESGQ